MEIDNLAKKYPQLKEEWSDKNLYEIKRYTRGSHYKAWWKCLIADHPDYQATICGRIGKKKIYGCPYCSGHKVCKTNSFGYLFPQFIKEWCDKNDKTPYDYTRASHYKAWWKCLKNSEHPEYQMHIYSRCLHNYGCPYCCNRKICKANSLAYSHPDLIKEWGSKNLNTMYDYSFGSGKKVWWKCLKNKSHPEYIAIINDKIRKNQHCPYCSGHKVCKTNSLGYLKPEFIKEWSDKNDKTPYDYTRASHYKAWWKCLKNNKHSDYQAEIYKRTGERRGINDSGCPTCKSSKGEIMVENYLQNLRFSYIKQKIFKNCRYIGYLRFDFYVTNAIIEVDLNEIIILPSFIIEYHGQQHYYPVKRFGGEKQFIKQQKCDKIKKEFAEKNNIPFLEIKYDKNIAETIDNFLLELCHGGC